MYNLTSMICYTYKSSAFVGFFSYLCKRVTLNGGTLINYEYLNWRILWQSLKLNVNSH